MVHSGELGGDPTGGEAAAFRAEEQPHRGAPQDLRHAKLSGEQAAFVGDRGPTQALTSEGSAARLDQPESPAPLPVETDDSTTERLDPVVLAEAALAESDSTQYDSAIQKLVETALLRPEDLPASIANPQIRTDLNKAIATMRESIKRQAESRKRGAKPATSSPFDRLIEAEMAKL